MSIFKYFLSKKTFKSLREFKETFGYSQKQLAERLEISQSLVSLHLAGKRKFGGKKARKISKITGIPLENLIQ